MSRVQASHSNSISSRDLPARQGGLCFPWRTPGLGHPVCGLNCSLLWVCVLPCNLGIWILRVKIYVRIFKSFRKRKTKKVWSHLFVDSKIQYKWIYLWNRKWHTDIESRLVVAKGKRVRECYMENLGLADANSYM